MQRFEELFYPMELWEQVKIVKIVVPHMHTPSSSRKRARAPQSFVIKLHYCYRAYVVFLDFCSTIIRLCVVSAVSCCL